MTLILGLECADGLLLASDGQATIGTTGQPLKGPIEKLFCAWNNVAWGGSGHVGIIQRVEQALCAKFPSPDDLDNKEIHVVRELLASAVAEVVRPLLTSRYIQGPESNPFTSYLFVGHVPQGSFILEIGPDLLDEDHMARGYSAIGSGDIFPYFALTGLRHFNVREHNLAGAKLIAYRVVDDAIRAAAMYLGPPIQMVEIRKATEPGGLAAAHKLDKAELRILEDKVAEWRLLEAETLEKFVGVSREPPDQADQASPA